MPRPLIVMPVGTSLLNNDGGTRTTGELNDFLAKQKAARNNPCVCTSLVPLVTSLWEGLMKGGALARELGFRRQVPRRGGPRDALPQELSYLALWANEKGFDKADVALLASDSQPGRFCACAIYQVLQQHREKPPWSCYCVYQPVTVSGLRVDKGPGDPNPYHAFRKEGIPNLVKHIQTHVRLRSPSQLIINISGGYKGAIPYTTLAAHLLAALDQDIEIAIHYLFEDTEHIIELPIYPIGLDFAAWHREWNLMQAAVRHPEYRPHLHHRVRAVLGEGENQREAWKVEGSVPHLLHQQYRAQRDKDPLQIYSDRVVTHFLPADGNSYQSRLLQLVHGPGTLIWYGDQVPMAAEHAARHHHHLLELAEILLTPLADACVDGQPFLNQAERFVLLAALLLHDCGHTVSALPLGNTGHLIPLFPSEVRDLHHFLAWYRLTQGDASNTIGWDPQAQLAEEVAWLCVYHRARMGWDTIEPDRGREYCPFLGISVPAPLKLMERRQKSGNDDFAQSIDFPKLVALLRIIDGLDIQSHRVGPKPSGEVMQRTLEGQAETARARVRSLLPAAEAVLSTMTCGSHWRSALGFLGSLRKWLDSGGKQPTLDARFWKIRDHLASIAAAEPFSSKGQAAALWTEVARAYDEFCVRHRQFIHFAKHSAVAAVSLLPADDFDPCSRWTFEVTLSPSPEYRTVLDCSAFAQPYRSEMGVSSTLREWIEAEIMAEASDAVLSYLSTASGRCVALGHRPKWDDSA